MSDTETIANTDTRTPTDRAIDFMFETPEVYGQMTKAVAEVYKAFDLTRWDRFMAVVEWKVGKYGQASAVVTFDRGDGVVITFEVKPFSVLMFRPEDKQVTVCLCFAQIRDAVLDPRKVYSAYALPLGGAFNGETLVAIEDLLGDGGLVLGDRKIDEIAALTDRQWTPHPFDGRTTITVTADARGTLRYHGKRCFLESAGKPTAGEKILCRALDESLDKVRVIRATAGAQTSAAGFTRRVVPEPPPAATAKVEKPRRQRKPRGKKGAGEQAAPPVPTAPIEPFNGITGLAGAVVLPDGAPPADPADSEGQAS
jgi:hypothetical protein